MILHLLFGLVCAMYPPGINGALWRFDIQQPTNGVVYYSTEEQCKDAAAFVLSIPPQIKKMKANDDGWGTCPPRSEHYHPTYDQIKLAEISVKSDCKKLKRYCIVLFNGFDDVKPIGPRAFSWALDGKCHDDETEEPTSTKPLMPWTGRRYY